ncbi:hypothetical protein QTP70_005496 [Hemibagrus guttatus]|uniref:ribonuclease H n=1 Tax=Hemibagrus guttatus TaxID=175788 RepID=A0AAE0RFU3_9TELE|nr:hypothetical protein QTP70_005496 [Hemibagrus guttatus]
MGRDGFHADGDGFLMGRDGFLMGGDGFLMGRDVFLMGRDGFLMGGDGFLMGGDGLHAGVPREELWYCMRKSGVAEKYVRVVQDMYERSRTVVRCAVGQTEEFKVEVGLHQGSALSPFLFAMVMDQLSEEVRQESPWTMMFADDIAICSESREQVEENLERWRFALERRGMKVSRSKTEYMCVNEREGSGTVRLQGEEVKKVQEFKYLRSTVQSNGECGKEVKKRVTSSKSILLPILAVTLLLAAGRQGISYMFSKYIQVTLSKDLKNIQKTYLKAPNSCFWVAECQGRLVGTVACLPAERNEGCLELKRMSLKRTHRGMGIAKALCRAVADFAQARGFPAVIVYASVVQTDAQKLYENMGYKKSPDLNPIEMLWLDLKRAAHARCPSNLSQLAEFCKEECAKIPKDRCDDTIRKSRGRHSESSLSTYPYLLHPQHLHPLASYPH